MLRATIHPDPPPAAHMNLLLAISRLTIVLILLPSALDWRAPALAGARSWALLGLVVGPLAVAAVEVWVWRASRERSRIAAALAATTLGVAFLVLAATLVAEGRFQWMRREVLAADPARLEQLGRQIIVGYRDPAELEAMVEGRAVCGVFVAVDQVQGRAAHRDRGST